jgi:lipopolysaccharide export system permease protein
VNVIFRYITSGFWKNFASLLLILFLVLTSNELAHWLSDVASGELAIDYVFKILLYSTPELLGTLLPIASFLGVIFSVGRLWADSEMIVLWASGYTWVKLVRDLLISAIIVSLIVGFISIWLLPRANLLREQTISQGEANSVMNITVPGRFQAIDGGKLVFYVEDKDDEFLKDIFIAQMPEGSNDEQWRVIVAKKAKINYSFEKNGLLLTLLDGSRYVGTPGNTDYTEIYFSEYRQLYQPEDATIVQHNRVKLSGDLLKSDSIGENMEFEMRLAKPISVIVLLFIALALSKLDPRKGRFVKLFPAIIIYVAYFNLITVSSRSVASGKWPVWLGPWWVHMVFLLAGLIWLAKESGMLYSLSRRRS